MFPDVGSTMVPPGLQLSAGLRCVDHLDRDAVLRATAGVEVLDLGRHRPRACRDNGIQLNQRGITDELTDVPRDPHGSIVSGPACGYQVASRMYSPICLMERLASDTAGAPS